VAEETSPDCNRNVVPDECDISSGSSQDLNGNGIPDECVDNNLDGIFETVDVHPTEFSNEFSDEALGGVTTGTVESRGDQLLAILDEPQPGGIQIGTGKSGEIETVISSCGGATSFSVSSGDQLFVTCVGVTISVIGGTVEVTFVAEDGTVFVASVDAENTLAFEPGEATVTAAMDNTGAVVVLIDGRRKRSVEPGETVRLETLQLPGDCNGERRVNIADGICTIGVLFRGDPPHFPCGTSAADEPNVRLLDWQPDGFVDVSDAVAIFGYLFQGRAPHWLSVPGDETRGCVPIAGCPDNTTCP